MNASLHWTEARDLGGDRLLTAPDWLCLRLAVPHRVLGWAPVGCAAESVRTLVWHRVQEGEGRRRDGAWLARRLAERGLADGVGIATRTSLEDLQVRSSGAGPAWVRCLGLVRPSQPLRSDGRAECRSNPGGLETTGIQLVIQTSHALTREAATQALALASEASTVAVFEARLRARDGGRASGSAGGVSVVLCPLDGAPTTACGARSALGAALVTAVHDAVAEGIECWLAHVEHAVRGLRVPAVAGEGELLGGWFEAARRRAR